MKFACFLLAHPVPIRPVGGFSSKSIAPPVSSLGSTLTSVDVAPVREIPVAGFSSPVTSSILVAVFTPAPDGEAVSDANAAGVSDVFEAAAALTAAAATPAAVTI